MKRFNYLLLLCCTLSFLACQESSTENDPIDKNLSAFDIKTKTKGSEQSLTDYQKFKPRRPSASNQTIYLCFLDVDSAKRTWVQQNMSDYLEAFFQLPVKMLEGNLPLKRSYFRTIPGHGPRLRAHIIINELLPDQMPDDAFVLIGVCDEEIVPKGKTATVFGQGDLKKGTGIVSLSELGSLDEFNTQIRVKKVISKTVCQSLGMKTSYKYVSLLNRVKNISQLDNTPVHLASPDLKKLHWNLDFDLKKRLSQLKLHWGEDHSAEHYTKALSAWQE